MSHNVFSRRPAMWTSAAVLNARDLSLWDLNQFKGVDGDNGGVWNPKSPIGIGGAGVQLGNSSLLDGGLQTSLGGRYVLGASDFPTFANRTRTVRFPLRGLPGSPGVLLRQNFLTGGKLVHRSGWFDPTSATVLFPIDSRFIHNGATISALRVYGFQTQLLASFATPPNVLQTDLLQFDIVSNTLNVPTQWQASHVYAAGALVIPLGAGAQTGLYYKSGGGTSSGGGQPNPWPNAGTVLDGTVTWTTQFAAGTIPQAFPYYVNAYYNNGLPWTVTLNPITGAGAAPIASASECYAISIAQDTASWCWTAAEIDYINIPSMAFA